jgi:ankyrin repeat protein/uncharacterized protein YegL
MQVISHQYYLNMHTIMDPQQLIADNLVCPLSLDYFKDPITIPVCSHTFEREFLVAQFAEHAVGKCPTCNAPSPGYDPEKAPKNVTIANVVEAYMKTNSLEHKGQHQWKAQLYPLYNNKGEQLSLGLMNVSLTESNFSVRPSLFICIVDQSGSMAGTPWKQVQQSLVHMDSLSRANPLVKTIVIAYQSHAYVMDLSGTSEQARKKIMDSRAGGGNNETHAFQIVRDTLSKYKYSDDPADKYDPFNVSNVTIGFLTDGMAAFPTKYYQKPDEKNPVPYWSYTGPDREERMNMARSGLSNELREAVIENWNGPVTVHAIGFSGACDRSFLEMIQETGKTKGTFQYAEPSDGDEALVQKLTNIYDVASKSSSVPVTFTADTVQFMDLGDNVTVDFSINQSKKGEYVSWVDVDDFSVLGNIVATSHLDKDVIVPIQLEDTNVGKRKGTYQKWISMMIDQTAKSLVELGKTEQDKRGNVFDLHCALLQQNVDGMSICTDKDYIQDRLSFLSEQVAQLRKGAQLNMNKLGDMQYSSKFAVAKTKQKAEDKKPAAYAAYQPAVAVQKAIKPEPEWKEPNIHYSFSTVYGNRNEFQKWLLGYGSNKIAPMVKDKIDALTIDDMLYTDEDGNNTLHILTLCGQDKMIGVLLQKFPDLDVNVKNNDGETPLTIAIKKRGYYKTIRHLNKAGAEIPGGRKRALEKYAAINGYIVTGKLICAIGDSAKSVNKSMAPAEIRVMYDVAEDKGLEIDVESYLEAALCNCMDMMVKTLVKKHGAQPTFEHLMEYCIPPKADHPEVERYLELAKLVVNSDPTFLTRTNANGESVLFKSCEKGNLPHVKYFITRGCDIDQPTVDGNSPLWVSCAKRYPCIIEELLNSGANPDLPNKKGNPPLYSVCQKGPLKVAEQLMTFGASAYHKNTNGDTLILICCRNGQHEILRLLLNSVDPDFVDFKAHIDGFNAIMASAEANRPECIEALHDYEVDLNQKTDDDNKIIAGATPLHIASYYNCIESAQKLLSLGADPNAIDIYGQTPMHHAVLQRNINMIKILRNMNSNLSIKDKSGNTAASYCRDQPDIRTVLVDPALDIMMHLTKGGFNRDEEKESIKILHNCAGVYGCTESASSVNLIDNDGTTPLYNAILRSKFDLVELLLDLGANPNFKDQHGHNAFFWANIIKNPRIVKMLSGYDDDDIAFTEMGLERVANARKKSPRTFFLGKTPNSIVPMTNSGIGERMDDVSNFIINEDLFMDNYTEQLHQVQEEHQTMKGGIPLAIMANSANHEKVKTEEQKKIDEEEAKFIEIMMWESKVFVTGLFGAMNVVLSPEEVLMLCLYTNNSVVPRFINGQIMSGDLGNNGNVIAVVESALKKLPGYKGEIYMGANAVDRQQFMEGGIIERPTFTSASTIWRVALNHVSSFEDKKKGTIFIIHSKNGKYVSQYSQSSYDAEVMFNPGSKFKVKRWYRGDTICLGQANIREHTFGIKPDDFGQYIGTNKALIIELEEL